MEMPAVTKTTSAAPAGADPAKTTQSASAASQVTADLMPSVRIDRLELYGGGTVEVVLPRDNEVDMRSPGGSSSATSVTGGSSTPSVLRSDRSGDAESILSCGYHPTTPNPDGEPLSPL